jgi:hypothetical protein
VLDEGQLGRVELSFAPGRKISSPDSRHAVRGSGT